MLDPDEAELSDEDRIEATVSDLPLVVDVQDSALEPDESAGRARAMESGKPSLEDSAPPPSSAAADRAGSPPQWAPPATEDQTTFAIPEAARKHQDNG